MSDIAEFLDRHTAEVEPLYLDFNDRTRTASLTGSPDDASRAALFVYAS